VLAIELGGVATNLYDRLQITNSSRLATLGGTVRASLVNNFLPALNDSFTFLTVLPGTRNGTFASLTHPTYVKMALEYSANAASMRVTEIAPTPLLASPGFQWRFVTNDLVGNAIWRLYPTLTWPTMEGAEYYILHTTNVASTNWSIWPTSGPPLNLPAYLTATGAVMTVEGPSVGTRIRPPLSLEIIETREPAHFYRVQFRP
jgi:hypothetical protein